MSVKFRDYYETLGVSRTATEQEIKKAYRKLAQKFHPDVSKDPSAETRFKEINEAYDVLGDPEKRKKYDSLGANWKAGQEFRPPPGWENVRFDFRGAPGGAGADFDFGDLGGGFSDFFEMFFGGRPGGRSGRASSRRTEEDFDLGGTDQEAHLTISLEEAYHGARKTIQLQGDGGPRTYQVRIPPGTMEGSRIRLAGQGGAGRGGNAGDLYLRVHIEPHPVFHHRGHDLERDLPLTPWEAALGAKVQVQTLDGKAKLTIPPGTQSGRRLRLRGHGMPSGKGLERGDLILTVLIVVPVSLSDREKTLFEELARHSPFRPER